MEILRTENLSKVYDGKYKVQALDQVNLSVEKGSLLAIVGDSGSGKSTLLHILGGVDHPTSGRVFVQGTDITELSESEMSVFRRRNIGIIYQFFNLIPNINVRKNICLPLLLDRRKPDHDYYEDVIQTLGIVDKQDRFPNELSGGEQQRVAIARSLISRPAIILADEPTGNLDRRNTQEIVSLFKLVNKSFKATIILVTHNEKVALACEKVYTMVDGRLYREDER
ncbi:MAG: ABC transporter ATP-binding protein [Firmicutes bacterium]|nr:ABC transporter ATP-binding protein [Bacillota bacterium]